MGIYAVEQQRVKVRQADEKERQQAEAGLPAVSRSDTHRQKAPPRLSQVCDDPRQETGWVDRVTDRCLSILSGSLQRNAIDFLR
jgi:hypothetical protein